VWQLGLELPESQLRTIDGSWLYRALQDTKTDDRALLTDLLGQCSSTELRLLDLCGGTGRLARLAIELDYSVTVVDWDTQALKLARERSDLRLETIKWDLSVPLTDIGLFDAIVCAHNAVNEVGALQPIFRTAASALKPGGWFYCEAVTRSPYPREFEVELLLTAFDPHGTWMISTAVLPIQERVHDLLLFGDRFNTSGRLLTRIEHTLRRRVFPADEIVAAAISLGLAPVRLDAHSDRFIFHNSLLNPSTVAHGGDDA
jgi:SAM-dependent methyltransferase